MPKIPECYRCQLYSLTLHLVCAIHPSGPETDKCLDFAPNATAAIANEDDDLWFPVEDSFYNGELIPESHNRLTREEQWELLETHPLFTGRCPQCVYTFSQEEPPAVHWDCPSCGWVDESV